MESFEQFYHNDMKTSRSINTRRFEPEMEHQNTWASRCQRFMENTWVAWFFTVMIVMNAGWIAIETDLNDAENLWEADLIFQLVENTFGAIFTLEMVVRFLAFARKFDALFDAWFLFDSLCTASMMTEIWFVPLFSWLISGQQSDADFSLSLFRLARLLRVTRVGRLVRILPDLITLLKGLSHSLKPVLVSALLLSVLVLLFAILFRSQVKGEYLGRCCLEMPKACQQEDSQQVKEECTEKSWWKTQTQHCQGCDAYFHSIPETVFTLLFNGTLLDSVKKVIDELRHNSSLLTCAFIFYIFVTNCAVLNLLIGIVCGVVAEVKETDKEKNDKQRLMSCLSDIMRVYDEDGYGRLKKEEFELFITNPEVKRVLTEFQVDVWGLSTFMDVYAASLSQDVDEGPGDVSIAFQSEEILDIVLRLRGGGGASVSDIVNLRRYAGQRLDDVESKVHDSHTDSVSKLQRIVECALSQHPLHREEAMINST